LDDDALPLNQEVTEADIQRALIRGATNKASWLKK